MERVPNGKYTREFREEAVKLMIDGGLSIPELIKKSADEAGFDRPTLTATRCE
ncbi:MAG: hypothetical protein HQK98_09945 [Nitrospirae bacterium]|nr:hypothetical protein [Nitrospirota bacterium]